jgi:hypothetical protein
MHGTGVFRALRGNVGGGWCFRCSAYANRLYGSLVEKAFRVFAEAMDAVCATEVVSLALVLVRSGGVLRIDRHSTDGIDLRDSR